jgi:hypothetical protein
MIFGGFGDFRICREKKPRHWLARLKSREETPKEGMNRKLSRSLPILLCIAQMSRQFTICRDPMMDFQYALEG